MQYKAAELGDETLGDAPAQVSRAEIEAALHAAVNSDTFARADRARALLSYLVETEQRGDAGRLKGFTIAQDVFGKDDDFDPAMDAVVRVQAGRLREHLASFYAGEGRDEPVRIAIPKGTYVPSYVRRGAAGRPEAAGANGDGSAAVLRHVDFGAPDSAFKLDGVAEDEPLPASRRLKRKGAHHDPLMSPFIVRNIKRFWFALATIMLLLTVILFLVWR
ncbi:MULTISPECIES: hypothetical protein [unclassified Roseitalea]|uniref:hypothetical protein n=1 Tax=unclassified Roseitalea TaxID=2639107 RepID=UPI00273F3BEE|nr:MULTISPECIES: hypothetical protein [unclassified Roseitalea]